MLSIPISAPTRRTAVRRAASFECSVHSPLWDGAAFYQATDVSPYGLWLSADLTLEVGERLELAFRPPRWPEWAWPILAVGEVVRVSLPRRRGDRHPAGMGVRFTEIDPLAVEQMQLRLQGLPPPLPRRVAQPSAPVVVDPDALQTLVLDDGTCFELCAEAELLTAGRPAATRATTKRPSQRRQRAELRARPQKERRTARRAVPRKGKPNLRLVS
jgi:hypothetical protein